MCLTRVLGTCLHDSMSQGLLDVVVGVDVGVVVDVRGGQYCAGPGRKERAHR